MSFIKKTLKKAWNFVKKNWKTIVLVAAIVFTAGIATVGFAAFSGVSTMGGFLSAVGQTMWAGVMGTAGSMGIGSGAVVPTTEATILAGTAGTNVGLGAAWGAGSGHGLGVAGKASAKEAATVAAEKGITPFASNIVTPGQQSVVNKAISEGGKSAVEKGLMSDAAWKEAAWKTAGIAAPIVGAGLIAAGEESEFKNVDYWAVESGSDQFGPGVSALAAPGGGEEAVAGAGAPGAGAADAMFKGQMNRSQASIVRPLLGQGGTGRDTAGRLLDPEEGLMSRQGGQRYG